MSLRLKILASTCVLLFQACSSSSSKSDTASEKASEGPILKEADARNIEPRQAQAPAPDESIDVPQPIAGSYLKGGIISAQPGGPVRIGIVGMKDDTRISEDKERYISTWSLEKPAEIPQVVSLGKSEDPAYDQVLEYSGGLEDLRSQSGSIFVSLQFRENRDGSIVNHAVEAAVSTFLD